MSVSFTTKGPYPFIRDEHGMPSKETLDAFWREKGEIKNGIGVYIIASEDTTPWYVGRTDKGFQKRFLQHLGGRAFRSLQERAMKENLVVIFLCFTTPGGKLKNARQPGALTKTKAIKPIRHLEYELIGICHKKNGELINSSDRAFQDGFSVPGYCGARQNDKGPAATALRNILKA